ncbi:ABC transporter ATP-binding protein [Amphibacillus sp. Q70]|uniref:ABC transporter ATP-binding protein n=1 Tax=Amphibacillus sp. Q70 TaxID=3453416 RepID=UPI003F8613EA
MGKPIISFQQFSFKYHSQIEPTLKNINLTIDQGEKVLILGPSGSGKSTLAHCLNGLVPFSYKGAITGTLTIKGKEAKTLDIFSLSKIVGTVLQDTDGQFIGLSVGEDIAFALENENVAQEPMQQIVQETTTLVGVNSHIDYSIHELSGGLKQRVSLGGILVEQDLDILLFDEPLANLDPATGHYAMELIGRIQQEKEKTVIVIEHRLEEALQLEFDRVIVINEGEMVSDTTPNQLLASKILDQVHIREPLYTKALKYSGCVMTSDHQPQHIEQLSLTETDIDKLKAWQSHYTNQEKGLNPDPLLSLDQVNFSYDEKRVLSNISFTIQRGEMISLVGKNGAGKSTLAKVICGFEQHANGSIKLDNKILDQETIFERANRIGFVLQNPNQMISKHLIFDEVALGLKLRNVPEDEIEAKVHDVLRICGLYPFRNWPISALSFGQKKRLTVASILVLEPEIIILDEPTAGQDLKHFTEIMDFLQQLNQLGVTIIFITHDMHLMLEYTSRALVLADGQLIADQRPVDVLTNDRLIEQAHLKRTSLFDLALKAGIEEPKQFIDHFISHDRKVRKTWQ